MNKKSVNKEVLALVIVALVVVAAAWLLISHSRNACTTENIRRAGMAYFDVFNDELAKQSNNLYFDSTVVFERLDKIRTPKCFERIDREFRQLALSMSYMNDEAFRRATQSIEREVERLMKCAPNCD